MKQKKWYRSKILSVLASSALLFGASCEYVDSSNEASLSGDDAVSRAAAKPFPQHVTYTSGVLIPGIARATMDAKVTSLYSSWKTAYLKTVASTSPAQKFVKYESGKTTTVSEAHGWGMVITAYMGDQTNFNAMYYYYKAHPSTKGKNLMAWKQKLSGSKMVDTEGVDSATDGDMDIAYGLLLADKQWGSSGTINYKSAALNVLHDILSYDVNQSEWILLMGDWAKGSDETHTRPSDFMIEHLLVFAAADTANSSKWTNIYNKINTIVKYQFANGSKNTGLMPDFMVKSGSNYVPVSGEYLESSHDGDFDYNSCRTPWRLAMAYITKGKTDLLAQQQKQASWIKTKSASKATGIKAGYYVKNGTNGNSYQSYDDLCFTAPFAVNAMISGNQTWVNTLWTSITGGDYDSTNDYYGDTIRMQVLIVLSGNWWLP